MDFIRILSDVALRIYRNVMLYHMYWLLVNGGQSLCLK